ncbi:MAG: 16S rRNA (guanine(966)-N(2))-methyltransferase RsmD [Acidobacteriota bacterium]|nr:16S rRNA (guanine(966)-N(2))-methyltransferase RsmD [Acidobacteriota bacterium]MDH3530979.1 16S rRNA (guanine(966)-N(2))-methyltransferase RsmD [Acidobacteriota bacterium]
MRVIAGSYRGRKFKSPPDNRTRPTSDRLRETLFNIIGPSITPETRFLDLCAGTGAIGIEALSRGAGYTGFVEKVRKNCALIEENLDLLGVPEELTVVECSDAEKFLRQQREGAWDFVYFDPPYDSDYAGTLSNLADDSYGILAENAVVIVEHHFKNHLVDEMGRLRRWRLLRQGETALSFYESV